VWDRPLTSREVVKAKALLKKGVHWKKIGPIIGATNPSVFNSMRSDIAKIVQKKLAAERATVYFLPEKNLPAGMASSFDAKIGVIKKPKTSFEVAVRKRFNGLSEKKKR